MKTSKKTYAIASIIGILCTIIGGLIVYAAISSQLDINGTANFQPETWAVQFNGNSLSSATLTGKAEAPTPPTLSTTAIGDFNVVLKQPGDSVAYTFLIENTGTIDSILSTYTEATPTFTGTGDNATVDQGIVSSNLQYTLKYIDDGNVESMLQENGLTGGNDVAQGDILKAQTAVKVELKIDFPYDEATATLPTEAVTISGLNKSLIYSMDYQQSPPAA